MLNPVFRAALLVALGAAWFPSERVHAQVSGPQCNAPWFLGQTMSNGARWEMCWERRDREGIVLSDIFFTNADGVKRKVLAEIAVAQIHVPYDDNRARYHDVSDYGLGTDSHQNRLTSADCPAGQLVSDGSRNVVCRQHRVTASQGVLGFDSTVTSELVVFSVSHVGAYNYIPQYTFFDDGTIEPAMGATGRLQRYRNESQHGWELRPNQGNFAGVSHLHNYYWRLDFDLAGDGTDDIFEEINIEDDGNGRDKVAVTRFNAEVSRSVAPEKFRRWRVRDGNIRNNKGAYISYEITAADTGHRDIGPSYEPWTFADIYLTRARGCERFASHNPADSLGGCGANGNLASFANNESVSNRDQVVWFGLSFHHIPRDEDEPYMHAHWNRFQIRPRDWNDASGAIPALPPIEIVENFETNTGWSTDSRYRDGASSGSFAIGTPEYSNRRELMAQPGEAAAGQSALVTGLGRLGSASANDLDGGKTSALSPPINIPTGTSAEIEFSFFFGHTDAATKDDWLAVKIQSADQSRNLLLKRGGSGARTGSWRTKVRNISEFMGKQVRILVIANDGGQNNLVEAGFDEMKITINR